MKYQDSISKLILGSKMQQIYNYSVRSSTSEVAKDKVQVAAISFWTYFDATHMLTKNVHAPVYSHSSRTLKFEKINNFSS